VALPFDGIFVAVPAHWDAPGAGAVPTLRNKGSELGRLEPLAADIGELLTAGMMLPGALFSAQGSYAGGTRIGVWVGLFDTGRSDPIAAVDDAVAKLTPAAIVSEANVCGREAVRTLQRWDDGEGGSAICDYWAPHRRFPTSLVLLRFWRTGPAMEDAEEIIDNVVGSLMFCGGANWAGPLRFMMERRYGPPKNPEPYEPGRWRFIGWRVGTVCKSKMIPEDEVAFATEMSPRRRDALLFLAVWVAWIVAVVALSGVGFVLLLSAFPAMHAMFQLRSRGPKAVVTFAALLAGLSVYWFVM
jgi:hypothetical protein